MTKVSIDEAKNRLSELIELAESGESVVLTRGGQPVLDLVRHKRKGGLDFEAGGEFLRQHGVTQLFSFVADDFDAPLPEDFLLKPLP